MSALPPGDRPLDESEAEAAFGAMLDGAPSDEEIARFLVELSDRGETASEIAGAARAMPISCRSTRAGLASGPIRLKIVRLPSALRIGWMRPSAG